MTGGETDPIEIRPEDLEEEPAGAAPPERLVIESEDLAEEPPAEHAYPGFLGPPPAAGLHVVSHCSSGKGEFVLELTERKEGGYWMQVAKGKSSAGVGRTLSVQGPFSYGPELACPFCGAPNIVVCECGALVLPRREAPRGLPHLPPEAEAGRVGGAGAGVRGGARERSACGAFQISNLKSQNPAPLLVVILRLAVR